MAAGVIIMIVATVTGILGLLPLMGDSALADWTLPIMAIAYAVMMFASSFVEEEQHFWYWVASGWFMALFLKECGRSNLRAKTCSADIPVEERTKPVGSVWLALWFCCVSSGGGTRQVSYFFFHTL